MAIQGAHKKQLYFRVRKFALNCIAQRQSIFQFLTYEKFKSKNFTKLLAKITTIFEGAIYDLKRISISYLVVYRCVVVFIAATVENFAVGAKIRAANQCAHIQNRLWFAVLGPY